MGHCLSVQGRMVSPQRQRMLASRLLDISASPHSHRDPITPTIPGHSSQVEDGKVYQHHGLINQLGNGSYSPEESVLHPHGQHVPVPGPLSSHGHLPPPGFSSDPTSLSPRVTSPSIRAFLGPLFFHHTLLSNLQWGPLRSHLNSCPKLLGTTEKSLR